MTKEEVANYQVNHEVIIGNQYPILKKEPQLLSLIKSSLNGGLSKNDFPYVKNIAPPKKDQSDAPWAGAFGSTV